MQLACCMNIAICTSGHVVCHASQLVDIEVEQEQTVSVTLSIWMNETVRYR